MVNGPVVNFSPDILTARFRACFTYGEECRVYAAERLSRGKVGLYMQREFQAKISKDPPCRQSVNYVMGRDISDAVFYINDVNDNYETRHLTEFAMANDLATVPAITQLFIGNGGSFKLKVTNARGIRVLDIFQAFVKE